MGETETIIVIIGFVVLFGGGGGFFKPQGKTKTYRAPPMSRLPAKVLIVDRLGNQYLITVQVSEKYPCTFDGLSFGENKPHLGSYRNGWLDLVYHQNPGLRAGQSFPLWAIE